MKLLCNLLLLISSLNHVFFGSVFTKESTNSEYPECKFNIESTLNELEITEDDLQRVLSSSKTGKSPGPDLIHPRLLKELAVQLSHLLTILFQRTMDEGKLPKKWKNAEVRPIFKKVVNPLPTTTDR